MTDLVSTVRAATPQTNDRSHQMTRLHQMTNHECADELQDMLMHLRFEGRMVTGKPARLAAIERAIALLNGTSFNLINCVIEQTFDDDAGIRVGLDGNVTLKDCYIRQRQDDDG